MIASRSARQKTASAWRWAAQPEGLQDRFVRPVRLLAGIDSVAWLAMAFAVTRLMASLLFGTRPLEPVTFAAVTARLLGAAGLASTFRRSATRVNPADALRTA